MVLHSHQTELSSRMRARAARHARISGQPKRPRGAGSSRHSGTRKKRSPTANGSQLILRFLHPIAVFFCGHRRMIGCKPVFQLRHVAPSSKNARRRSGSLR